MIPQPELEKRWTGIREKMKKTGVDLVLATSQENFYYLTGSFHHSIKTIPDRLAIVGLDARGNIFAVLCNLELGLFKSQSSIKDTDIYVEFEESPIAALTDLLRQRGLADKKIGIEARHLVAQYFQELVSQLPKAQIVPWDKSFFENRLFKTPYEIDLLQKGGAVTEKTIYETWKAARFGISEKEMGQDMIVRLLKGGAEGICFLNCLSGIRTTIVHAASSPAPIERGALIKVDFGGFFEGYVSDVARVAFMGEVSPDRRAEYSRFVQAHEAIIDFMKPGVTASQVFYKCKEVFKEQGLPFDMPHIGHSIGLTGHEDPLLQPYDHTVLAPGMVFAVEPRSRVREKDRYHVEDLVLITEKGPKGLTNIKANEEVFIIP